MSYFDAYRDSYRAEIEEALPLAGLDVDRFTEAKARHLIQLAERELGGLERLRVLDVGAGAGETDRFLRGAFGTLEGTDLSEGMLERARATNPGLEYRQSDPSRLPYDDDHFDLTFCINVIHHVPPAAWDGFATELARVTRPGGLVAVFEHNPLNPLTRRVVSRCRFDEGAVLLRRRRLDGLLAGQRLERAAGRYILFLPLRGRWGNAVDRTLGWLPLGAQYYVAARVT